MSNQTTIVAFISDVMMASKIEAAAKYTNFDVTWVERGDQFGTAPAPQKSRPGEALSGPIAALTRHLTTIQPSLLIFDMSNAAIPWLKWVQKIKSSPATRRIPIICFGPHVLTEAFAAAKEAEVDAVLTRGKFVRQMAALMEKWARKTNVAGIEKACEEKVSAEAKSGIDLFNQRRWYDAHHALEAAWNADQSPARELYRAILQTAIAYLQIERGNFRGAQKMLLRLRQWLTPLPARCRGINLRQLRQNIAAVQTELDRLGAENIADFEKSLFKPLDLA